MKIPKREVVKFVIKSVLHKRALSSQEDFSSAVNKELKKVDPAYVVTGRRLRQIAASMPEVKINVELRKGKMSRKCPVCSSSLKKVWTRNLKGRRILDGLRCQKCAYRASSGKWSPGKYRFSTVKKD